MARRVVWYGIAAVFPAAFVAGGVGSFRCGIYGCAGAANPSACRCSWRVWPLVPASGLVQSS